MPRKARLGPGFNIGGDQAEADPLLDEAFYTSGHFTAIEDRLDPHCFVVGRTGSGKSAVLTRLYEAHPDKVIRIVPEDLSLPYITNLDVVQRLRSLDVDLQTFWKALWRHVLIVEVIRHRYRIDSPDAKQSVLQSLREKIARNPGKKQALAYLDEFEGKFWAEADERVKEITTTLTKKVTGEAKASTSLPGASAGGSIAGSLERTQAERVELQRRYQRIINETQLARLSKMMDVLDEDILSSPQDYTYIVIDDLDKDWVDASLASDLIMALFKTVHDLKRVKNLKVLVALRTNIFEHLDFGAASGGQEEKYRSLVLPMNWTRAHLINLVDERVRIAARRQDSDTDSLSEILPHANSKRGNPADYLLDRTLLRPRDLISFVRACVAESEGKSQISWETIKHAETNYSESRLLALRDEWKPNYPGIERAFEVFRKAAGRMSRDDAQKRLDDCILLLAEDGFTGTGWLQPLSALALDGRSELSWEDRYGPILRMLYDIGFLGIASAERRQPVFASNEPAAIRYARQLQDVDYFFVARAYHAALEISAD